MVVPIVCSIVPLWFKESNTAFVVVEYVCVVRFIIDYLPRWATTDLSLGHGKVSFALYPFTPMAIVDLLSILPAFIALNPSFKTLRILRIWRALRAFKLLRYYVKKTIPAPADTAGLLWTIAALPHTSNDTRLCALSCQNAETLAFDDMGEAFRLLRQPRTLDCCYRANAELMRRGASMYRQNNNPYLVEDILAEL